MKFPKRIHITIEPADEPFLIVRTEGIEDVDDTQPCAIYELVEVGIVEVTREFLAKKKRKK
jgi:hypothetical protein